MPFNEHTYLNFEGEKNPGKWVTMNTKCLFKQCSPGEIYLCTRQRKHQMIMNFFLISEAKGKNGIVCQVEKEESMMNLEFCKTSVLLEWNTEFRQVWNSVKYSISGNTESEKNAVKFHWNSVIPNSAGHSSTIT